MVILQELSHFSLHYVLWYALQMVEQSHRYQESDRLFYIGVANNRIRYAERLWLFAFLRTVLKFSPISVATVAHVYRLSG